MATVHGNPNVVLLEAAHEIGAAKSWGGGPAYWWAVGTFDNATATLKISPDGGTTWLDGAEGGLSLTAAGGYRVDIPGTFLVRVDIASAGASTSISSGLSGV